MLTRLRWRLRALMLVIALSATTVWVGVNWFGWREAFQEWRVNRLVWQKLDQPISIHFPKGVPLDQLLAYIKQETQKGTSSGGLTIYVDSQGLQDAGFSASSQDPGFTSGSLVKVDTQYVPLKDALRSALKPHGLTIWVSGGIVSIVSENEAPGP
jgi:hypothetical protein